MLYQEKTQQLKSEDSLEEHKSLKGFFKNPNHPNLYLSREGLVWCDFRERFIKYSVNGRENLYPTLRDISGTKFVHILLAQTFIVKPENCEVVNHRDGNKKNISLDNLEWVTWSENSTHAYMSGLRSDNKPVLLKDLESGEVREFFSLNACARHLGKSASHLSVYLNKSQNRPFLNKYELVWKGRRWLGLTKHDIGRPRHGLKRAILACETGNGKKIIFPSAAHAAEELGLSRRVVTYDASGKTKSKKNKYKFVWLDEYVGEINGIPIIEPNPVLPFGGKKAKSKAA